MNTDAENPTKSGAAESNGQDLLFGDFDIEAEDLEGVDANVAHSVSDEFNEDEDYLCIELKPHQRITDYQDTTLPA